MVRLRYRDVASERDMEVTMREKTVTGRRGKVQIWFRNSVDERMEVEVRQRLSEERRVMR